MVNIANVNYLPQTAQWEGQIPQLEDGWWPTGGVVNPATDSGLMNWQAQLLGNRTAFLKQVIDNAGLGASTGVPVTNLNTHTINGTFRAAAGATGSPIATEAITFEHAAGADANSATQEALSVASDRSWIRRRVAGVWQAWREVGLLGTTAGLVARAANGSPVSRTITQGAGVVVTHGSGEAGNPTIAVDLVNAFGSSRGTNGWQRLPSGLIIQWGKVTTGAGVASWTFPISFPNAVLSITGYDYGGDSWSATNVSVISHRQSSLTLNSVVLRSLTWNGSSFVNTVADIQAFAFGH